MNISQCKILIATNDIVFFEKIKDILSRDGCEYDLVYASSNNHGFDPTKYKEIDLLIWILGTESQQFPIFIFEKWPQDRPIIIVALDKPFAFTNEIMVSNRFIDFITSNQEFSRLPLSVKNALLWRYEINKSSEKPDNNIPQKYLEYILNRFPQPVFILDKNLNFVFANESIRKTLGKDLTDLIGKPCYSFMHNTDKPPADCPGRTLLKNPKLPLVTREQKALSRYFQVCCVPFKVKKGHVEKLIHFATDITELKETETRLHIFEERYLDLLENATDLIQSVDDQGKFIFVNKAWRENLGYDLEDLKHLTIFDIIDSKALKHCQHIFQELSQNGGQRFIETKFITSSGDKIDVEGFVNAKIENGQFLYTRGILRNVTSTKRAMRKADHLQAQLLQAQKMEAIGRLAGGLAHDFNNMLTVILGYSQLVMMGMDPENPQFAKLSEIEAAAKRAQALTRQVLAFSRKQVLNPKVVDMNPLLENMKKMLLRLIGEDISINLDLDPNLSTVKVDPGQMEQVIINLCVNAKDAMPDGGIISISTRNIELDSSFVSEHPGSKSGPHILLKVTDTGCGMDQETLSHIFEPFFTTKAKGKGTGLGLATIYGIVKQSNGYIWVDSVVKKGTSFSIYLPVTEKLADISDHDPPERFEHLSGGYETILVVEDNPSVRNLIKSMLKGLGYNVLSAHDGEMAIQIVNSYKNTIHLLLTDIIMPQMNGTEVANLVNHIHKETKVLFMSGYSDQKLLSDARIDLNHAFIEKPFTTKILAEKIRYLLDKQV